MEDRLRRYALFALLTVALACGGSDSPTAVIPSPLPTPTPVPTPTPNPYIAACGTPLPAFADSYGFGIKVQLEPTRNRKVLNTNPLVRNMTYCQQAGFGSALICNTRLEDSPQRVPCDHYLSGISDTGRPGPNWFQDVDGRLLKFEVLATDRHTAVVLGHGEITRVVVDRERFLARVTG